MASNYTFLSTDTLLQVEKIIDEKAANQGLLIGICIIGLWLISLVFLLNVNLAEFPHWLVPVAIAWQAFLFTGLFITAHDGMHGAVAPNNPQVNHFVGKLAVCLYGFLSYKKLIHKHWQHHHHPASELDPDFHDGRNKNFFSWYFYFMKNYWSWKSFAALNVFYYLANFGLHVSGGNLLLFWILPLLLSSLQLFYFGTFLPHKEPEGGYTGADRAQTLSWPFFWSFVACYHFGYHKEHHQYPQAPWWQLPKVYQFVNQPAPLSYDDICSEVR